MTDNILKQFSNRLPTTQTPSENEPEVVDDCCGVFGFLRGVKDRAIMVSLLKKDGSITAFAYSWLERVEFCPSSGLVLHFGGHAITIQGRNLNAEMRPNVRLVDALTRHRVPWIRESDKQAVIEASKQATVIESIEW